MDIPYTVKARPDTGLWNAKIGIWLFLASEVMLFGGLFSSYIFLRIGADYPWPVDVQKVALGFTNTLVLILSSVTVVFAWASLKMRKYRHYQIYMAITLLCAVGFMCIKYVEYSSKLTHYSLRMNDGGVVTGHLPKAPEEGQEGYDKERPVFKKDYHYVVFDEVNAVVLNTESSDPGYFLKYARSKDGKPAGDVEFTYEGEKITTSWLRKKFREKQALLVKNRDLGEEAAALKETLEATASAEERKGLEEQIESLEGQAKEAMDQAKLIPSTVEAVPSVPLIISIPRTEHAGYAPDTEDNPGTLNLRDGSIAQGNLTNDDILIEVDELDLQALNLKKVKDGKIENARVFDYLGDDVRQAFLEHMNGVYAQYREKKGEDYAVEEDPAIRREALKFSLLGEINSKIKPDPDAFPAAETGGEKGSDHHTIVEVYNEDIKFYSNFSPRLNTYYAIYYLLTGLHGLHVLGGIVVLGYFLFFGRKLYEKNPEHMANRVEVGGLFWHFVDLVWIFLFPILYLM